MQIRIKNWKFFRTSFSLGTHDLHLSFFVDLFNFFFKLPYLCKLRNQEGILTFRIFMFLNTKHEQILGCFFWATDSSFPAERIQFSQLKWSVHHDSICYGQWGMRNGADRIGSAISQQKGSRTHHKKDLPKVRKTKRIVNMLVDFLTIFF